LDAHLTVYITLTALSGVLNLFLGIYVFVKRHLFSAISTIFLWAVAVKTIYCFGYAFSLTSSTLSELRFWSAVQYMGMPFAPPLGLMFVLTYLGYKLTKGQIAALLIIPVVSLLSNITNDFHHLHYKKYAVHETLGAPYYSIEIGVTYIIMSTFLYLCLLSSMILLISRWKDTNGAYRSQLLALIAAHLIPMVTSILYLTGLAPAGIDPVPMVVGLSSLFLWWAIESSHFLAIMPIAKDVIFQSISDGVLVLDQSGRLVEFNGSCQRMFPKLDKSMFGWPLERIWTGMFGASSRCPGFGAAPQELEVIAHEPEERTYQLRYSPIAQNKNAGPKGAVLIITDITEFTRLKRKLEKHAYYDDLTQILNRRAFFEQCEARYDRIKEQQLPFTVILFDIDHFKRINDSFGHRAGDQALVSVVRICETCLTENMIFARYGGEEFVLALFGHTVAEGQGLAELLRQKIAATPIAQGNTSISVTASFGIAGTEDGAYVPLETLLSHADEALYEAKRGGRNRVCVGQRKTASNAQPKNQGSFGAGPMTVFTS